MFYFESYMKLQSKSSSQFLLFHVVTASAGFLLGFFQGGTTKNFLGGASSKFSGANDSRRGTKIF